MGAQVPVTVYRASTPGSHGYYTPEGLDAVPSRIRISPIGRSDSLPLSSPWQGLTSPLRVLAAGRLPHIVPEGYMGL